MIGFMPLFEPSKASAQVYTCDDPSPQYGDANVVP
jgi:hypothetical protein